MTYIPKIQTVRGEERQIAYGWIEDNPWDGERERKHQYGLGIYTKCITVTQKEILGK